MTDFTAHFQSLYRQNPDPWNYAESTYERQKYDATCAVLRSAQYKSGIEIGCSIGVLSVRLAARCDRFVAVDLADKAVRQAAERLSTTSGASAMVANIPEEWPAGRFDLIVLSEVIYYLTTAQITTLARRISESCLPRAECVLVNWLGHTDTAFTGIGARVAFCNAVHRLCNVREIRHAGTADYDHVTLVLA